MANNLYFSRDTKLFATFKNAAGTVQAAWEIPILEGFSFSQGNETSEITLSEMESSTGVSRRGRRLFNDSLSPAEWSFSTYVRPFEAVTAHTDYTAGNNHAVEEVLWAQMAGGDDYNTEAFRSAKFSNGAVTTTDGTDLNIAFTQSNRAVLQPMDFYFVIETNAAEPVVYKLEDAVVNEASVDFEVDGIATINWSGFAKEIKDWTENTDISASYTTSAAGNIHLESDNDNAFTYDDGGSGIAAKDYAVSDTDNFIRNRLSQVSITAADSATFPGTSNDGIYNLTLTNANITISNNIEYLVPAEIGKVNIPLENVTGTRTVTGSMSCYINYNDAGNSGTSTDLFNDMKSSAALDKVVNDFAVILKLGGTSGKRVEFNMADAHLEIPTHNIEDVISFDINFHGLDDIDAAEEVAITYFGA